MKFGIFLEHHLLRAPSVNSGSKGSRCCFRLDTILLAAEKGIGALSFAFIDPEEAARSMVDYQDTLAEK